jgi:hypothetical protein
VKRIAVIGAGGAGKTRLACALGQALDLPVVHLDAHYYGPGWRPLLPACWEGRQRQLDGQFLAYVLTFRRRRPALLAELASWNGAVAVVRLRSRRAVRRFLAGLPSP